MNGLTKYFSPHNAFWTSAILVFVVALVKFLDVLGSTLIETIVLCLLGVYLLVVGYYHAVSAKVDSKSSLINPSPSSDLNLDTGLQSETLRLAQQAARFGILQINAFSQRLNSSLEFQRLYHVENPRELVFIDDWLNLVHEQDRRRAALDIDRCFREDPRYRSEFRIVRKDGTSRYILANGYVQDFGDIERATLVGIQIDITRRRELENAIAQDREDEQMRISHELHDGIGQQLTGLGLLTKSLHQQLEREGSPHTLLSKNLCDVIPSVVKEFRSIVRNLMPTELDSKGLPGALQQLAEDTAVLSKIQCTVDTELSSPIKDVLVVRHLYRIAQEAMNNAVKHAHASRIHLKLIGGKDMFELTVADDGTGLSDVSEKELGMGLQIFKHRAESMGATLQVESDPGLGTTIRVHWQRKYDDGNSTWSTISDLDRR